MTDPMAEYLSQRDRADQTNHLGYPVPDEAAPLTPGSRRASTPLAVLVMVAGVVGVLVVAGMGIYLTSAWIGERTSTVGGPADPGAAAAPEEPAYAGPLMSADGFELLRKALAKETGGTEVIDMTIYPKYAVVEVLEGSGPGRTRSLYFDGDWSDNSLGTTTDRPFDIARVDAEVLAHLSRRARLMVDDADSWYVILRAPDAEGAAIYAYASNAFGEGGYLSARIDGKVLGKYTW